MEAFSKTSFLLFVLKEVRYAIFKGNRCYPSISYNNFCYH